MVTTAGVKGILPAFCSVVAESQLPPSSVATVNAMGSGTQSFWKGNNTYENSLYFGDLIGLPALGQNGQLVVSVVTSAGLPVPNTWVIVTSRPLFQKTNPKALTPGTNGLLNTGADGHATFSLPLGAYAICGLPTDSTLLDSCSFSAQPQTALVAAAAAANVVIKLQHGVVLTVQIKDMGGILSKNNVATNTPNVNDLSLTVRAQGAHQVPIIGTQISSSVRQFSVLVPPNADLQLQIGSRFLQVADSSGKALPTTIPSAYIRFHSPGTTAPPLSFSIVGVI